MTDPDTAFATARRTADALHDRAMRLGYNVGLNFHVDTDSPARAWFPVWRVDQESNTAKTFSTAEQVNKYLDELEKLPRYCLDLLGNPRIRTELDDASDGHATWIIDTETGQRFGIRTADLKTLTRLCIHAERQPTIGNWQQESS
jgi:hypothetical protein